MTCSNECEPYGFIYEHDHKEYAFHIMAASPEEAEARLHSMIGATSLGRLRRETQSIRVVRVCQV